MNSRHLICACVLLAAAGCREAPRPPDTFPRDADDRVVTAGHGPVRATLAVSPPYIDLAVDNLLQLTVEYPSGAQIELPTLVDRLTGFMINGLFDERTETDERASHALYARLTPTTSEEYRIAPLVIRYTTAEGEAKWFHTPPMVIDPPASAPGARAETRDGYPVDPLHIPPAPVVYLAAGAGLLAAFALLIGIARWLPRMQKSMARQSPRQQALREINALSIAGLIEAGQIKDCYRQLTHIVRRFIEREYRIRAPSLTTREFLAAATRDDRFPADELDRLGAFLEAADLVKFAGREASPDEISAALATARAFVSRAGA